MMNLDNACRVDRLISAHHHHDLDRALHDLGMLSTVTDARRDYLRETQSDFCMMRLNTRYVSNVTVGYCMKRAAAKNRLCPYLLPSRHRTKSENSEVASSEASESHEYLGSMLEPSTSGCLPVPATPAKRCQSLENLNLSVETTTSSETSQEMDCVSTQIQNLQVDE